MLDKSMSHGIASDAYFFFLLLVQKNNMKGLSLRV